MDDLSTGEKEEKIINDTYTIRFWSKTEDNKNLKEEKDKNGALFCEIRTEKQWDDILTEMAKNMKDKKIIKIFIAGETKHEEQYIKELPLSKELFSKILDCIDFDRQILIVENVTCFAAEYLMPLDKLLQKDGKYSHDDPSPINYDDKIVNLCKKKLQNDRQCFYYGATVPNCMRADNIHFIKKHSSSIDGERIVLRPNIALDAEANKKYINCLYNDILSLKTSQTNNDINNNSLMTNNQHNIPTYQSEMGNNMFGNDQYQMQPPNNFPPPPPQYPQIPYDSGNALLNNGVSPDFIQPNNGMHVNTNNMIYGAPMVQPIIQHKFNNTTNNNNVNIGATNSNHAMEYNKNNNISFQDNLTEKNNENVLCDLTKGFCSCCKCW